MKKLLALLLLGFSAIYSQEKDSSDWDIIRTDLAFTRQSNFGKLQWDADFYEGYIHSVLLYPISGNSATIDLNIAVEKVTLGVRYYFDAIYSQELASDSDYLNNWLYLKSIFTGTTSLHDVRFRLGYLLNKSFELGGQLKLNYVFLKMTGGKSVIYKGYAVQFPYRGLNSIYETKIYHFGLYGKYSYDKKIIGINLEAEVAPIIGVTGEGFWNLRNLSFGQRADKGYALATKLSFDIHVVKEFSLTVGYYVSYAKGIRGRMEYAIEEYQPWQELPNYEQILNTRGFDIGIKFNLLNVLD